MEPQARMRLHAWGLRQHQGRGIAASALTEAYAVRRLYHDRRLTLRGGRASGAGGPLQIAGRLFRTLHCRGRWFALLWA